MADIKNLIAGYRRFHKRYFSSGNVLYKKLANLGQSPKTLIIACSDSRVDPSILTNAGPGDIFSVRNVANLVPPYDEASVGLHGVSAALEFAVRVLKVRNIVVLGHSNCAGIMALLNPDAIEETDFIGPWMEIARPAREKALHHCAAQASEQEIQHVCEKEAIQLSLQNLQTFPWIRERVEAGKLELHGWYFTLANGKLQRFNPENDRFEDM